MLPQSPTINVPFPLGVQRGKTLELTLTGTNLAEPTALLASFPVKATFPTDKNNGKDAGKVRVKLEVPANAPIGYHSIRLATKHGLSNMRMFCVDEIAAVDEVADNKTKEKAQPVPDAGVVVGRTEAETSDFFKVSVKPGQRMTFDVIGRRLGSLLDPVIKLYDAKTGREMPGHYSDDEPGLQSDCPPERDVPQAAASTLPSKSATPATWAVPDYYYRLRIADCPGGDDRVPLGHQTGIESDDQLFRQARRWRRPG